MYFVSTQGFRNLDENATEREREGEIQDFEGKKMK